MSLKYWILGGGSNRSVGMILFPRWAYPAHPLMPQGRTIGYRPITKPPRSIPVTKEEAGHKYIFIGQRIDPRIDYTDLSLRIGIIIAAVICGLLMLRLKNSQNKRRSIEQHGSRTKLVERMPDNGVNRSTAGEPLIVA
jgi:hypothetical protein